MGRVMTRVHWRTAFVGALTVAGLLSVVTGVFATRMLPMNLVEMSAEADRVVVGLCTARQEGEMPSSPGGPAIRFTEYTFHVTDNLKGNTGQTLTIRQVRLGARPVAGATEPPLKSGRPVLPDYQPGQEVMVFLGPESSLGLTSPVALDQAVFDVETQNGQRVFKHRFANRGLNRNMSADQLATARGLSREEIALFLIREHEAIPSAPFLSLVRKLSRGN